MVSFEKTYETFLTINVVLAEPLAKHAEFKFGSFENPYDARTESITMTDGSVRIYVMPDVTAVEGGKIGSTTVNGKTVYYPITEMFTSDGKTEHTGSWYACFPIFKNAVQIIDYADKGAGEEVKYNQNTVEAVNQIPTSLRAIDPQTAFRYEMNANTYPAPTEPHVLNNIVCYTSNRNGLTASNERDENTYIAEYTYTDNMETTYYYYVGYHCAKQTDGSCVTPDTLVTLADGTQKRIDQVSYNDQLLVWDFYTGSYTQAPASIIWNHGVDEYTVISLRFDDGTVVNAINSHGFFDTDENNFVYITDENVKDYVGHNFVKVNGSSYKTVKLVDYTVERKVTGCYSLQSAVYNNFIVEDMFSMTTPDYEGWFDYFNINDDMKYDEEHMHSEIAKYGLTAYEDVSYLGSYELYVALNAKYLNILIGRGVVTMDEVIEMLQKVI